MARDMRCEPEFLKTQTRTPDEPYARFACFVRGMGLTHPFSQQFELGYYDRWPKMSDSQHALLLAHNRNALKDDPPPMPTPLTATSSPPPISPPPPQDSEKLW
jgi:hypothetical protein